MSKGTGQVDVDHPLKEANYYGRKHGLKRLLEDLKLSDWENTVSSLGQHLSKVLGASTTAGIEILLQKVTVVDNCSTFDFDSQAETPQGTFATLLVLLFPDNTDVQARVSQGSQVMVNNPEQECKLDLHASPQLGCIAFFTGCEHTLRVTGSKGYTCMTYHLVQPAGLPLVIMGQPPKTWFLGQLRQTMDADSKKGPGPRRSFYLFKEKYDSSSSKGLKRLLRDNRQMADFLQQAEQQGLIDVFVVTMTRHEWLHVPRNRVGYPKNDRERDAILYEVAQTVGHWRRLDGSKPGWKERHYQTGMGDCILQGEDWFSFQEVDREENDVEDEEDVEYNKFSSDEDEYHINLQRRFSRAGFVIWNRQNRWPVFCNQGVEAAYAKLNQMIATYKAFTAQNDPAAAEADSTNVVSMPPSEPCQEESDLTSQQKQYLARQQKEYLAGSQKQTLAGCREDIVSLIRAMYDLFDPSDLYSRDALEKLGYKTFSDIALAFDLSWIYHKILAAEMKGEGLHLDSARQLMYAAKAIGWSKLYPILSKLADFTCADKENGRPFSVLQFVDAFHALEVLLGVEDAAMQPAVAAIAKQLANAVTESISDGRLYREGYACPARFSTKPWQKPEPQSSPGSQRGRSALRARWSRRGRGGPIWDSPHVGRGMCAANCKLVVLVFGLFQGLTEHANQAGVAITGLEEASCTLIDECLANPQYFYVTEVLGPACVQIAEAQADSATLAESPAAIKLMAGCVHQLKRAAQLEQPGVQQQERCTCDDCQLLQRFLADPDQSRRLNLKSRDTGHHVIKELQHLADAQEHVIIERASCSSYDQHDFLGTKEAQADKVNRMQDATMLLANLQPLFTQVVVGLFLKSGQAPPEPVPQPKSEPEP